MAAKYCLCLLVLLLAPPTPGKDSGKVLFPVIPRRMLFPRRVSNAVDLLCHPLAYARLAPAAVKLGGVVAGYRER